MNMEKQHRLFLGIAIVYMFFNGIGLPEGLLYTTLLAPLFLLFLLNHKGIVPYLLFLAASSMFGLAHFIVGIADPMAYLKSFVMLQAVALFTVTAYYALPTHLEQARTFRILTTVNLLLLGLCLVLRFIPSLSEWVWYKVPISPGVPIVPRLKMFTYEASYYSLLISPLALYYWLRYWLGKSKSALMPLCSLLLSLLLSFSLGVLAAILIGLAFTFLAHADRLYKKVPLRGLMLFVALSAVATVCLYIFYPHNPLFLRLHNIWAGKDTSARGRTYEAFSIAWEVAKMKSPLWGIGLGQLKGLGRDYIVQYYHYANIPQTVRIPNAVAETLNIYGALGILCRFVALLVLFIRTKVWTNYYRLWLFSFLFIYQFTGSFISNTVEYVMWAIAFCPTILKEFDVQASKNNLDASTIR